MSTPILAVFVPLVLVLMVDGRRGVRQTWLAALVGGVGFGVAQFLSSNFFSYQVADIIAASAGALALVLLLRVWQPSQIVSSEGVLELHPVSPSGAPPLPAAPDGIAGTHRVASVQARSWSWLSSAGNNVTAIQTTDFGRAQHQLASRCGAAVIHLMKTATFLMDNFDYASNVTEDAGGQHDWMQLHRLEPSQ